MVYKCKMCNANLPIESGAKILKCEYCDTFQTIPSFDDEKKITLINRANYFRQNGEFDKAYSIYEHILEEDVSDPEIYWSLVLCKYGIEYVEDPATKQKKATVNRTQKISVLHDADYLTALEKSDEATREYYISEAEYIDKIQKKILSIASEEERYDVFISYKEKNPDGNRTKSSVIAQDLYDRLESAGYRTFFSRISLEDKIGNEYEPYIYSALQSARVMLVLGTRREEFVAPWVKNEWSRYLLAMKDNPEKKLIPCYCDVDVYELPDEFQILQGQDMSKIGYEQDLIRGIGKLLGTTSNKTEVVVSGEEADSFKNAETYLLLENYAGAENMYVELCQRKPEDYRSWWGRIRAVSKEFKDTSALISNYDDFRGWMKYIKKLTRPDIYNGLVGIYVKYVQNAAIMITIEEQTRIRDFVGSFQKHVIDLEREQSKIRVEDSEKLQQLKDYVSELEGRSIRYRLQEKELSQKRFQNRKIATQIEEMRSAAKLADEERRNVEADLRIEVEKIHDKWKSMEEELTKENHLLREAKEYIGQNQDVLCEVLVTFLCREISQNTKYDDNLYQIRERLTHNEKSRSCFKIVF